ncbi:MAG: choice-of-anchor J domain-containing protein [Bacteroidales bacterium]|nr:choice-of-anchor J domain-containing protein [Bacteroidales bacterium]
MKHKVPLTIAFLLFSIFVVNAQNNNILWTEDFEGDWSDNWYVDIGTWEVGTPTSGPQSAFVGNNCAATVLNGNYTEPVDSRLIRYTSFVVPAASENPTIRFWHWWHFALGDWGEVQLKTSNGEWVPISIRYDEFGSDAWYRGLIDLSEYADSTVQLAFYFHSKGIYYPSDVNAGWYIDDVSLVTGPYLFNNPEDFESGLGDWSVEKGTWDLGVPTYGPSNARGGQNCFGTKLNGQYHEPVDSRLISPPIEVPTASENPRLQFWHWWKIALGDYGEVQIKTNNEAWNPISIRYNNYGGDAWYRGLIDLSEYADSTVQLAFYFHSKGIYYPSDVNAGWYIDDVSLVTGPYLFNNPEDFESGLGDWSVEKGTWEVGEPTSGPSKSNGGLYCAGTILDGNYHEPVDSRLISRPFVVPAASEIPAVRFWHWFSFALGDWGEIQLTTDEGKTWKTISTQSINTSSGSWTPYYIPLTSYADSTVQLAFYFHSEGIYYPSDLSTGWYIDDVRIHDNSDLAVYAGPDVTRESGSSVTLNASVSGGTEPYVYEWIPSDGLSDPTTLNPVATPSDTTTYTLKVTDKNGCFRTDKIIVSANSGTSGINDATDILSYSFSKPPQTGDEVINAGSHTVNIEVEHETDLTNLVATFTLSDGATATVGGAAQESGITANDFTNPVNYLITAENGVTAQGWIVSVNTPVAEDETDILSYSFGIPPQTGDALVDPVSHTVDTKVEYGTDLTSLIATFTLSDGATLSVGGIAQQSGTTANDFTNPVTCVITALDGVTVQEWVVTVVAAALNDTDILSYNFGKPPQIGDAIVNPVSHTVDIEVENGTDLTSLIATFSLSEGATASVEGADQQSGTTANDFTNPVTYTITASDGETKQDWTITVNVEVVIGVDEHTSHAMRIYPNPFSNNAIIEICNPDHSTLTLSVFSVLGNKVFQMDVTTSDKVTLKKGNLSAGVYMIVLKGEKVLENRMIVIK